MRTYIKKLQAKPENTRKQILLGSLVASMSFVFIVWVVALGYRFSSDNKTDVVAVEESQEIKPFALFGQSISDTYKNITASVGNISTTKKEKENADIESGEVKLEGKQINLIPVEYQSR
jgi:hypothetical protein